MKLTRQSANSPIIDELYNMLRAMDDVLEGRDTALTLEELCSFQQPDGSFRLVDESSRIPNEAYKDFVNRPTILASAIMMKAYLNGHSYIKDGLIKGLRFVSQNGIHGHGYDEERTKIENMRILIKGNLLDFLGEERQTCPAFHCMIHNTLHEYNSKIINNETSGRWGEDYRNDWEKITTSLKPRKRLYVAYGSNMNKRQMSTRCPNAQVIGKAYIHDWVLTLPHYANIEIEEGFRVPVLVWEITDEDETSLNRFEGYPKSYDKKELIVNVDDVEVTAMAYVMTDSYAKSRKKAREGYTEEIVLGYMDAGFNESDFSPRLSV